MKNSAKIVSYVLIVCKLFLSTVVGQSTENFDWTDPVDKPLYRYGRITPTGAEDSLGDRFLAGSELQQPRLVPLGKNILFPYYGALYNYTMISVHGNIHFAILTSDGGEFNIGDQSVKGWPDSQDPALIAPYLCEQKGDSDSGDKDSGVHYRTFSRDSGTAFQNKWNGDFLDQFTIDLQEGIVGATAFKAYAALVVTWKSMYKSYEEKHTNATNSTYQLVWATNQDRTVSYVMFNYKQLGFISNDLDNSGTYGRCQSLFNGGNATGSVYVLPGDRQKHNPAELATLKRGPVRGRYYFRVDDIVLRGGCSDKKAGTVPLLIYPNIVNMLGGVVVDVNGYCWDKEETIELNIQEGGRMPCKRINSAIARCTVPYVRDWGTKDVFIGAENSRAYVGFMYFVPPGLDPMKLGISSTHSWFQNPITASLGNLPTISWYPKNFTKRTERKTTIGSRITQQDILRRHSVPLDLFVIGYKEANDESLNKHIPKHRILAKLASFENKPSLENEKQEVKINYDSLFNEGSSLTWLPTTSGKPKYDDLLTYTVGYLKLAMQEPERDINQFLDDPFKLEGIISPPISLHWLWGKEFPEKESAKRCKAWYDRDGNNDNFITHTEKSAPCPCRKEQAQADIGRFMPHPRCSLLHRSLGCATYLGAHDCYMSAENVQQHRKESSKFRTTGTHYGQVCCYDERGYLMHTSYQTIINADGKSPYNPGFPQRSYEFGHHPYNGEFQVPVLSTLYHDSMPYFFCCKWAKNRCQFFYWRRPSSGCQEYKPPLLGIGFGASHFVSLNGQQYTFNRPGIYTLLKIKHKKQAGDEKDKKIDKDIVNIQIRLERYLDKAVEKTDRTTAPSQCDYARPGFGTVITGIAMEGKDSERVQVVLRKDSRRMKYRTNVVVGGRLRYFDTMWLQRYKGVLVYVEETRAAMQSEVYVVLEKPQIGIKIREYYREDVRTPDRPFESKGILSFQLSLSPIYGLKKQGDGELVQDEHIEISGLMYPRPDQVQGTSETWTTTDVTNGAYLIASIDGTSKATDPSLFQVSGTGDTGSGDPWHTKALVEEPIYKAATKDDRFKNDPPESDVCKQRQKIDIGMYTYNWLNNFMLTCPENGEADGVRCATIEEVTRVCSNLLPCQYDYVLLKDGDIAEKSKKEYVTFLQVKQQALKQYYSCSSTNIEYPEYLRMVGSREPKYLEGNTITFQCQSGHWIKGDSLYKCTNVNPGGEPVMRWSSGHQPWCRSRAKERRFKWLAAIFGILGILLVFGVIFLFCWICKNSHKKKEQKKREILHPPYQLTPPTDNRTKPIPRLEPAKSVDNVYGEPPKPVSLYNSIKDSPRHEHPNTGGNPPLRTFRDDNGELVSSV